MGMKTTLLEQINEAFTKSYEMLKAAAAQIVGKELAPDLVHDTYVTIAQKDIDFKGNSQLTTYLCRAVKNHALLKLRKSNRGIDRLTIESDFSDESIQIAAAEVNKKPALPTTPADQAILNLYRTGRKWYLKAPEVLGISPGAARVRMSRLLAKLEITELL